MRTLRVCRSENNRMRVAKKSPFFRSHLPPQAAGRHSSAKTRFVIAPLTEYGKPENPKKTDDYARMREHFRKVSSGKGFDAMFELIGLGHRDGRTLVFDVLNFHQKMAQAPPFAAPLFETFWSLFNVVDPSTKSAFFEEVFAVIRQVVELGHEVKVHYVPGDRDAMPFVEAVGKLGVKPEIKPLSAAERLFAQLKQFGVVAPQGSTWARDRWVKIDGKKEETTVTMGPGGRPDIRPFGEGGTMLSIDKKAFVAAEEVFKDPRVDFYRRRGFEFYAMPHGLMFEPAMTDLMGRRVCSTHNHVDLFFGAEPTKRVWGADPFYYKKNWGPMDRMALVRGATIVEVPEEEADRHPACLLPLGDGRALVDAGAPGFIERLRGAGLEVVPTAKPLNHFIHNKAGLHCLFNED